MNEHSLNYETLVLVSCAIAFVLFTIAFGNWKGQGEHGFGDQKGRSRLTPIGGSTVMFCEFLVVNIMVGQSSITLPAFIWLVLVVVVGLTEVRYGLQ